MNEHMKILSDLNEMWNKDSAEDIKWVVSAHDDKYFQECVTYLKSLGVSNVLDIACGAGHFIEHCMDNKIEGYGIEPKHKIHEPHPDLRKQGRIVFGTFENFIAFSKNVWLKHYSEVKFDCITIHNTVHGLGRPDRNTLIDLLSIMRKLAKYIIITEPNWNRWNEKEQLEIKEKINWNKHCKKIYTFSKTYGSANLDHNLYKVI